MDESTWKEVLNLVINGIPSILTFGKEYVEREQF